jgi:hypothetical protein
LPGLASGIDCTSRSSALSPATSPSVFARILLNRTAALEETRKISLDMATILRSTPRRSYDAQNLARRMAEKHGGKDAVPSVEIL